MDKAAHLYSAAGFLDGNWWHRTYWFVGSEMQSGWGNWHKSGQSGASGRLLVKDGAEIYGYGRFGQLNRHGSHVGLGDTRYMLFKHGKGGKKKNKQASAAWSSRICVIARGMVLAEKTVFVAGPPDLFTTPGDEIPVYKPDDQEVLKLQDGALTGKQGGSLLAFSTTDGKKLSEIKLPAMPAWDTLAAAGGAIFVTTIDGKVLCLE